LNSLVFLLLIVGPLSGGLLALGSNKFSKNNLSLFLAFAGSYLLAITLLNLVPEVFKAFDYYKGILVLSGFFFQVFLEKYSKGVEHGHILNTNQLKNRVIPAGIVLSLSLHSFTEGFPLGAMYNSNSSKFYPLLAGIAIHEAPAAFALLSIVKSLKLKSFTVKAVLILYSFMATIGAYTSFLLESSISASVFNYVLAFVIGTFLHISTTILFESSEHHIFSMRKVIGIVAGLATALLISLL